MVVQIVGLPAWPPPRHVSAGRRLRPNVLALPARVWGLALLIVANWAISHSNILNMAFFMQSEHLGAPWTLGIAIALPALGSIITCGLFDRLHHLLGRYIAAAGLVVFCLGFVLLANVHSLGGLMLANVVIGRGGGALVPLLLYWTTEAVDDEHHEVALGVVSGCIHVGFIVAPFAQAALAATIGNPDVGVLFLVESVVLAVAALAVAVLSIASRSARRASVGKRGGRGPGRHLNLSDAHEDLMDRGTDRRNELSAATACCARRSPSGRPAAPGLVDRGRLRRDRP